jgi:hypothetical protein
MFDYDANIRLNINDTAALAALKKLEDRIAQLSDPRTAGALKNLIGFSKAKQEFSALKQERAEDLAYRKRKTRQIADELRLSNALELQEGRRIKLQRAGALDVLSRKKAIAKLDKISAANPKNAEIQERVATGLSRILTTQNEINRATNKNIGQKQRIADYNKQIDRLRELGATEGQLRKAQKRKYEFVDAAERRQTSLSDRRELQLKREIKLLGDTQKAARDAATAVTRPGTLSGGARSALSSGPAKSTLGSPKADKARFDFYEKNYKTALAKVFKTEQAYEKQLQANILNNIKAEEAAELASINRVAAAEKAQNKRINDEVKQSDRLQKAKEAGIAASAKAGGPSSLLTSGPAKSTLGSPKADKARFDFYEKNYKTALAKVFKTEQAYEKQLQANILNNIKAEEAAELASINRVAAAEKAQNKRINDEIRQNDRLQRAREAGITARAKAGGPRSALSSGPARSILGSPAADKARFKFYQKEYDKALANVFKTEQAYEKQLQTNSLNNIKAEEAAELASINRVADAEKAQNKRINDEIRQNDRLQRAREAGITARAKAGGPSSSIGGNKAIIGSPAYTQNLRNSGLALRQLAKSFDSVIRKSDKISGSEGVTGPLALPDSKTLKAATKGIQRIETSADRTQRFAERRAEALKRSEERSKDILEANKASVKAGKENAASDERSAKANKSSALSTRATTKNVKSTTAARKKSGQGLLNVGQGGSNLAAGVGFPLLFGGGPGSVLGGGLGAIAGGFGGSIIGGALGQQLDALGASALKTADALGKPTSNLEALINTLGIAGTKLASDLEVLQALGLSSVASAAATNQFEEIYGADAQQKFEQLNDDFKKFTNGIQTLGVAISKLLAGPFGKILSSLGDAASGAAAASTVGQLEKTLSGEELKQFKKRKAELQKATPGAFGSTVTQPLTAADEQKLFDEFGKQTTQKKETLSVDKEIKAEMDRQLLLAQKTTAVEAGRLTNRRDTQAAISSEVQIQSALNSLARINLNLENEKEKTKRRLLELDQKLAKEQVQQAKLAQQNAIRQAELQIYKDETNAIIAKSKVDNEIYQIRLKTRALEQNAAQQSQAKLTAIRQEAKSQEEVLRAKFELRKLDIKEQGVKIREATLLEAKVEKIKEELALKEKQIQQAEALRIIGVNQFQQQQDLNNLLAEQNALRSIQANSPERTLGFASAGLGFFADSAKLEADLLQKYNDDIDVFNRKIADAKQNLENLTPAEINDGRADPFLKQLDTVEALKSDYERLQPAINAAALEQQQFNDALVAVTPGVNALVGGLQEVVAGTKSAEEAFADFLNTIADQLIQTAATLIAQYIAIGLAKAFAGLSGSGGGGLNFDTSAPSITGNTLGDFGGGTPFPGAFRADGGPVSANRPYIVGERGPELLIPQTSGTVLSNEDSRAALAKYSPGNNLLSEAGDSTGTVAGRNETLNPVINISTGPTLQFEGEGYVKQEDFKAGLARAAQEGAKQGQTLTLRKLMMSPTARSKIGI